MGKWMTVFSQIDKLLKITQIQSELIDELWGLLSQYMTVEEAEDIGLLSKIRQVAQLRDEANPD